MTSRDLARAQVRAFLMLLAAWNGLFFMERVVGNYHVNAYKAKLEAKQQQQQQQQPAAARLAVDVPATSPGAAARGGGNGGVAASAASPETPGATDPYETSDHFTSGLPFLGMRVSVSRDDLQHLKREAGGARAAAEAYPASEGKAKAL